MWTKPAPPNAPAAAVGASTIMPATKRSCCRAPQTKRGRAARQNGAGAATVTAGRAGGRRPWTRPWQPWSPGTQDVGGRAPRRVRFWSAESETLSGAAVSSSSWRASAA